MRLFAVNVGRLDHLEFMRKNGMGRLISAGPWWKNPVDGIPWALDNGAYGAWIRDEEFPEVWFLKTLKKVPKDKPPVMAVCPDKVAAGDESLEFSIAWRRRLEDLGYGWMPWYLAVQDGMDDGAVERELRTGRWSGVFVGGTMEWKHATAEAWVKMAHGLGLPCHIGRVAQLRDLLWAERIGADSVDSTSWVRNDRLDIVEAFFVQRRLGDESHPSRSA